MNYQRSTILIALAVLGLASSCQALSAPMCKSTNSVWGTEKPYLGPNFPYADLWFFCTGGFNVAGQKVHSCINNGKVCGKKAADLVCQYLGYDFADISSGAYAITAAQLGKPARSMTGEWCINKGVYSTTKRDGQQNNPCQVFDSITCVRKVNKFKQLPKPVDNRKIDIKSASP